MKVWSMSMSVILITFYCTCKAAQDSKLCQCWWTTLPKKAKVNTNLNVRYLNCPCTNVPVSVDGCLEFPEIWDVYLSGISLLSDLDQYQLSSQCQQLGSVDHPNMWTHSILLCKACFGNFYDIFGLSSVWFTLSLNQLTVKLNVNLFYININQ